MAMIKLKQYVLDKQAEWGREISIKEMSENSGISRDTISRMLNGSPTRVDENTVFALCDFFSVQPGDPIPFLIYDPAGVERAVA